MKFNTNKDGNILSLDYNVTEHQNLVSIRQDIIRLLWNNLQINPSTVRFKSDNKILNINKTLLKLVESQDAVIDCEVHDDIDPRLLVIVKLYFENCELFGPIEVEKELTIELLRDIVSEVCEIDVLSIFKEQNELINGTLNVCNIMNGDQIVVIERLRNVFVYPILEKGDRIIIQFSNKDHMKDFKHRVSQKINFDVDDFILFQNFHYLEEEKFVKEYKIENESTVKYCLFRKVDELVQLHEKITDGLFSIVYRAVVNQTTELITVKRYNCTGQLSTPDSFKPMIQELIAFAILDEHPQIVQLKAFYRDMRSFYIGMEFMAGGSLHSFVLKNRPITEKLIIRWSKQILEGLAYLHKNRILHRDLKTSNILLDENNNIKISGFSLSKFLMGINSAALSEGFVLSKPGTFNFMAPEVFNEDEPMGSKADIWSFGAILIEIVTGQEPFHGMDPVDVSIEISTTGTIQYDPPVGMSDSLKNFIGQCLIENPRSRWSADELLNHEFLRPYSPMQ